MGKKIKNIKVEKFPKTLKEGSLNQKVFSVVASLIKEVVNEIESCIDLFCEFSMTSVAQKFHGTYYSNIEESRLREKRIKQWEIKRALKKLESLDYIKIKEDNKEIHLTKKGALEFIKYRVRKKRPKWDGKWRIVIFDIFEQKRRQRDFLRNRLNWLGFKELQKSVWVFPYDVKKEIEQLLKICRVAIIGDVRFLTVEKMDNDEDLREVFNLN